MLYNIPSAGFISQTLEALVKGTLNSVIQAHNRLKLGQIFYSQGILLGASVNRSPKSYANNPADERQQYNYDTDKMMQVLKFYDLQMNPMGMLNWFAVHGTSMNNTNHLISSDNKGYAAILFEQEMNPAGTLPGKGEFVAIFAQANEGDVSPNTAGPRCIDTGLPCDSMTSTCGNPPRNEKCIAFGPGRDMFESTKIIGYKQYARALELFRDQKNQIRISGPVNFIHEHIDMTNQHVPNYQAAVELARMSDNPETDKTYKTCQAALGYSFAAGTTDGPGAFDFYQAQRGSKSYWNTVRDMLHRPSAEQVACHEPKPILLNTGQMDFPYTWHPHIIPTQLFQLGQIVIIALPGEFTTMSGRRVRAAVQTYFPGKQIILSGLSNIYTSYITTLEEYAVQRYEGASTLYGPHTLQAYINQFRRLASYMASNKTLEDRLSPPDMSKSLFCLKPGVLYDGAPSGRSFGDVLVDVEVDKPYRCGQTVNVTFVSANPRNDLRLGDTFLSVERFISGDEIETVATDASWETKFIWERTNTLKGESRAIIVWDIPADCKPGRYVIRHFGSHKSFFQVSSPFEGHSSTFEVVNSDTVQHTSTTTTETSVPKRHKKSASLGLDRFPSLQAVTKFGLQFLSRT